MEAEAFKSFLSLSDDLILVIFRRFKDAETLARCSAVCKRFAALVSRVDTVVLPISLSEPCGGAGYPSITILHNRFQGVKNLKLQVYRELPNLDNRMILKWKVLYRDETHIDTCVIFFCDFLQLIFKSAVVEIELDEQMLAVLDEMLQYCLSSILQKVKYYLSHRISDLQFLRNVLISNSEDFAFGKLFIDKEEILKSRDRARRLETRPMHLMLMHAPVLNLPKFGWNMRNPMLFVVRPADQPIDMERSIKLAMNNFDDAEEYQFFDDAEEDQIFDEALKAMLENENKRAYSSKLPSVSF